MGKVKCNVSSLAKLVPCMACVYKRLGEQQNTKSSKAVLGIENKMGNHT